MGAKHSVKLGSCKNYKTDEAEINLNKTGVKRKLSRSVGEIYITPTKS